MRSSDRSAGFTLLEVLIAVVVFATVMGGLLGIVSQSVRSLGDAEREVDIMELAREQIHEVQAAADAGTPPELGETSGFFAEPYDSFRWEMKVAYFGFPLPDALTAAEVARARERSAVFAEREEQPTSLRLVVLRVFDESGNEICDPFSIVTADVTAPQSETAP